MAYLLDVNVLIALVDSAHVHHQRSQAWFENHHEFGWATCPFTENGMVRVLSQAAYPSGQRMPAEGVEILGMLKAAFRSTHQFWPDTISLTDLSLFEPALLAGARQVTDAYLLALAASREGILVSFDCSLPLQAVRNASKDLVRFP